MRSRFATSVVVGALFGASPLFSAGAFADSKQYVIETEPEIRILEPKSELRIIEQQPEVRVEVKQPGHYERQRVLVEEGRFDSYNVWVPKDRKGLFGRKTIPGHYEARERWVEPRYEYRDVWVPDR
jgi:hypothetical protein